MAWSFGDSFDLYAAGADMANGYWDSVANPGSISLVAGRFTGSRAFGCTSAVTLVKSSATNDPVHHFVLSYEQTLALSGTTLGNYIELFDGATAQCSIVFRSDGAILLASGGPTGTVLATFTGAVTVTSTWYAFEFEVVINSTTGSFAVRKNGNSVNDFSATALNTQASVNAYANKIQIGQSTTVSNQYVDDLFWRSGAASGSWLGDIRCYARMPASDQSVAFTKGQISATQTPFNAVGTQTTASTQSCYTPFVAAYDGTVSSVTITVAAGFTGNLKCAVFNGTAAGPTTVLASAASVITNPTTGANTFTFSSFTIAKGQQYWVGYAADGSYTSVISAAVAATGKLSTTTGYSAFPAASPTVANNNAPIFSWLITITTNNCLVNEPQQDGATTYVYDSNPGDADFYGIAAIGSTPAIVIATVTRAYMQKSDAGTRTAAVQVKSGATTVASATLTLSTSGWLWAWRIDLTDPNTGSAWTPTGVNNAQIGPTVIA